MAIDPIPKTPQKLKCPVAILKFRAQVAKSLIAQSIRKFPNKKLRDISVSGISYGLSSTTKQIRIKRNTKKFSPEWFALIHLPVPFVASLRKATFCTNQAIFLSIAAVILANIPPSSLPPQATPKLVKI